MLDNKEIHICERKRAKLIDAEMDSGGNIFCRACNKQVPDLQVDDEVLDWAEKNRNRGRRHDY